MADIEIMQGWSSDKSQVGPLYAGPSWSDSGGLAVVVMIKEATMLAISPALIVETELSVQRPAH